MRMEGEIGFLQRAGNSGDDNFSGWSLILVMIFIENTQRFGRDPGLSDFTDEFLEFTMAAMRQFGGNFYITVFT